MAKVAGGLLVKLVLVVSVVVGLAGYAAAEGEGLPPASGGKVEVPDVQKNGEVQQMGRYCVTEYNKGLKKKNNPAISAKMLTFLEVIKAEKQVVAGVKYYLRLKATTSAGATKTFDAEMVVGPGESSKELVTLAPSTLTRRRLY
ncbi:PREDICTED: cysteine proteinase inhibitor B-like isoform X1 [Ipomoea nil]|uniref:cysteine proteinase inhibitor B-like isoform X1 n=1 Tax=Ipomoea nil TaxID=35883 RepID=UPI00090183EA|nr:PREDICTED: cysteine proteinase inhibitor B-like isoform X1 [Ipomoea nil]